MPNPENVIGKGNRFSSTNQPQVRGRKPRLYAHFKKSYGLSLEEFREGQLYVMQLTRPQLEELASSKEAPIWIVNLVRAWLKGSAKGDTRTLTEAKLDLWGKELSARAVEVSGEMSVFQQLLMQTGTQEGGPDDGGGR